MMISGFLTCAGVFMSFGSDLEFGGYGGIDADRCRLAFSCNDIGLSKAMNEVERIPFTN